MISNLIKKRNIITSFIYNNKNIYNKINVNNNSCRNNNISPILNELNNNYNLNNVIISKSILNNNKNGIIINKYYGSKVPPLINTKVKRTRKELISMYILMFVSCSIICTIYYIAYLNYQRLEKLNQGLDELENLTDDEIREIIAESKRIKIEKEKENENKKKVPADRVLK